MMLESVEDLPDLWKETYDLVAQVPKGRVTTYGAVAKALGDIAASRFVGLAMSQNDDIVRVPCRRVVQSDGHIGGYTGGGALKKRSLLREEGVEVKGTKVCNFENVLFTDFKTKSPKPLVEVKSRQKCMKSHLDLSECKDEIERIAGIDVAYDGSRAYAAMVTLDYRTLDEVDRRVTERTAEFPYVPTYLGFREIPLIAPLMNSIPKGTVIMYDGNGILHPEGFGIASQLGVVFDVPVVGVAKKLLCGKVSNRMVGRAREVVMDGNVIGYSLAMPGQSRPVYISPGHRVSLEQALEIAARTLRFRVPEPVRMAHIAAGAAKRGTSDK
jgi:deoxyribonuclease V